MIPLSNWAILGGLLLTLDFLYLSLTSSWVIPVYRTIQGSPIQIRYSAALVCYLILIAGLYYFIIREKKSPKEAFLLGVFVYGVYDTTVLSIFSKYSPWIAGMDMVWGGVLFGTTTYLYQRFA